MTEITVVASKIKQVVKINDMSMSGDFVEAVSNMVVNEVRYALARARSNNRKTVRATDL